MQSSGILITTKDLCLIVYCLVHSVALYTERKNTYDFYTHGSLNRESNLITVQQDVTEFSLVYFCRQLYMFRVLTPSVITAFGIGQPGLIPASGIG